MGNGWVAADCSPGTFDCGTGRSSMGHSGSPVARSKTYVNACFVICATALTTRRLASMLRNMLEHRARRCHGPRRAAAGSPA